MDVGAAAAVIAGGAGRLPEPSRALPLRPWAGGPRAGGWGRRGVPRSGTDRRAELL